MLSSPLPSSSPSPSSPSSAAQPADESARAPPQRTHCWVPLDARPVLDAAQQALIEVAFQNPAVGVLWLDHPAPGKRRAIDLVRMEEYDAPPALEGSMLAPQPEKQPRFPLRRVAREPTATRGRSSASAASSSSPSLPAAAAASSEPAVARSEPRARQLSESSEHGGALSCAALGTSPGGRGAAAGRGARGAEAAPSLVELLPAELWVAVLDHLPLRAACALAQACKFLHSITWAEITSLDGEGASPLWCAAKRNQTHVVRLLIEEAGVDINAPRVTGSTPLGSAAYQGNERVVRQLLHYGALVDQPTHAIGSTALSAAANNGNAACVKALLAAGATVEGLRHNGATPLLLAAQSNHTAVVDLLLGAGAQVNARRDDGMTPLFMAATNGHAAACRRLLDAGADWALAPYGEGVPLVVVVAAQGPAMAAVLEDLVRVRRADVNECDYDGHTALHWAAQLGDVAAVQLLLAAGAQLEYAVGSTQYTPLLAACQYGRLECVKLLLAAGADVRYKTKNAGADTALRVALRHKHAAVVGWLVHGTELQTLRSNHEERLSTATKRAQSLATELASVEQQLKAARQRATAAERRAAEFEAQLEAVSPK